jgi:hypothetical protein
MPGTAVVEAIVDLPKAADAKGSRCDNGEKESDDSNAPEQHRSASST